MTALAPPLIGRLGTVRRTGWIRWVVLLALGAVLYVVFRGQWTLPYENDSPVFSAGNELRDAIGDLSRNNPLVRLVFGGMRGGADAVVTFITDTLVAIGWLGVIALSATLAYAAGTWRTALLAVVGFLVIGALGLWEPAVLTLGVTLAAVVLSVALGVPLGVLTAKSGRVRRVLLPILDSLQIMPQFAYLVPFVLLFGIGAPAAVIVTVVYAIPATIRITALGVAGVPATTVEAARSAGATSGQILRAVELPLARRAIALAVNQTIMLSLSMVIIAAFIDGPGLGEPIIRAMQRLAVGALFEPGIAVVILAIVLDRITEQASHRVDARRLGAAGSGHAPGIPRRAVLALLAAITIVAAGATATGLVDLAAFPEDSLSLSIAQPIDDVAGWIRTNLFFITSTFREGFTVLVLNPLETVLKTSPFWLVIAAAGTIATLISGARAAVGVVVGLVLIALLQLWEHSMETLAMVLVATAVSLALGIALGIAAARSQRFSAGIRPVLDAAQTMPAFMYLLPAIALFGVTRFTAIAASIVFAVPPVVRLVEAGIRVVPPAIVEASTSAGATGFQLLRKVQLPMARPALLLAANQGLIMVLGMVVLGGIVGAGGLGYDVVNGFSQRRDFGEGLAAGISIVLLGIVLDRITQAAGTRPQSTTATRA